MDKRILLLVVVVIAWFWYSSEGFRRDLVTGTPSIANLADFDIEAEEARDFVDTLDLPEMDDSQFSIGNTVYIDTVQGTTKIPNFQIREDPPVTIQDTNITFGQSSLGNYVQPKAVK